MDSIDEMDAIDEILNEENDEEIQLTPAEVIKSVEEAWINEKFAPEILPNRIEMVECLLNQIQYMEENLTILDSSNYKKSLHQLEIDRLKFLVKSYLRQRLAKIETYTFHILKEEEQRATNGLDKYLTDGELQFAKDYAQSLEQHFQNATSFIPAFPFENYKENPVKPNMNSFVFLKSKKNVEGVVIDDGRNEDNDVVDLNPGSRMIISYNSVANLIKRGDVQLI